jgi:hypothetical protein
LGLVFEMSEQILDPRREPTNQVALQAAYDLCARAKAMVASPPFDSIIAFHEAVGFMYEFAAVARKMELSGFPADMIRTQLQAPRDVLALSTLVRRLQSWPRVIPVTSRLLIMSDNPLKFLNPEDWKLVCANPTHLRFSPGDEIIREGSRDQIIYVLRKGTVRVELLRSGSRIEVARLSPGEIFGEMAFLEETGASAGVTGEDRVEVDAISGVHLYSLFSSFPGLATRFYQSLAFARTISAASPTHFPAHCIPGRQIARREIDCCTETVGRRRGLICSRSRCGLGASLDWSVGNSRFDWVLYNANFR